MDVLPTGRTLVRKESFRVAKCQKPVRCGFDKTPHAMTLTLRTDLGCTEAVIAEYCGVDLFHRMADLLAEELDVRFTKKQDDSETNYWDFKFQGKPLTLHFNIYDGVSIFPQRLNDASRKENEAVLELAGVLAGIR
jgi:hypothetical protein